MTDLATQLQTALTRAARYERLGRLAINDAKREEYRGFAKFCSDAADEWRALIASEASKSES
jgi:hypothetical protein